MAAWYARAASSLDGYSRDEAVARLGWTAGTLRGRALLRSRLARRGLTR